MEAKDGGFAYGQRFVGRYLKENETYGYIK